MGLASSIGLVGAGLAWRSARFKPAGRALVNALDSGEQDRTLAGMALVQAGERSVELIEERLEASEATLMLVRVLNDIGGAAAQRALKRIAAAGGEAGELARRLLGHR